MKMLINVLEFLHNYGIKGIYSLFFKVTWIQDIQFTNDGYDLIVINKTDLQKGYFTGTYFEKNEYLNHLK